MITIMTFSKVFHPTVLVVLLSLTVSGTSQEVSFTRGETARIPCLFGEGTLRNIYWYYSGANGTEPQKILTLSKAVLTVEGSYANRVGLDQDNSTLILKKITVKDAGTYRCDVERQGQTSVPNFSTKLNVYGLPPDTSPNIRQCADRPTNCSCCTLTANGPTNLSCKLHSVYPTTNVLLEWYPEGHDHQDSNFSISQAREDGTFELTNMLIVSKTGNWTCKASYMSAEGMKQTAASISVTILDSKDDTESPTNLVAIIVPIAVVIAVVILVVIFVLLWRRQKQKKRGKRLYRQVERMELGDKSQVGIDDGKLANIAEAVQDESDISKLCRNLGFRQFKISQVLQGNKRNNDVFATTSMLFEWKKKTSAAKQIPTMVKALEKSDLESLITECFPDEAGVSDEKLTELAKNLDHVDDAEAIEQLGINFGFRQFKVNQYLKSNKDHGDHSGTLAMLQEWKKKTPRTRQITELVEALKNSNLDGSLNNNQDE